MAGDSRARVQRHRSDGAPLGVAVKKDAEDAETGKNNHNNRDQLSNSARQTSGLVAAQWSNGQTEGQVNRLKFLKRQM